MTRISKTISCTCCFYSLWYCYISPFTTFLHNISSFTSSLSAFLTVIRLILNSLHKSPSDGSLSPGLYMPDAICFLCCHIVVDIKEQRNLLLNPFLFCLFSSILLTSLCNIFITLYNKFFITYYNKMKSLSIFLNNF